MISDESWPTRRPVLWDDGVSARSLRLVRPELMTRTTSQSREGITGPNDITFGYPWGSAKC